MDDTSTADLRPPVAGTRSRSIGYFLTELLIVTAGVLIALSVDSLRGWNRDRQLVEQARRTIALEIAENRADIERIRAGSETRQKNLDNAREFVNEMLATKSTNRRELQIHAEVADLSSAAWQSAASTGALSHMNYDEVQRYSRLYAVQNLYMDHQRQSLRRVTGALALLSEGDPHAAAPEDLRLFRQEVRALIGELYIENRLGERLVELYREIQGQ
jgi:hypothetical protein